MPRKTLVEIDEELLDQARAILGTPTIKDTVATALREVVVAEARRRYAARMAAMEDLDLDKPEVMHQAWR